MNFKEIKTWVMMHSRKKKLKDFYAHCSGGSVLDVGVSSNEHNSSVNILLNNFRFNDKLYTGLGIQDLTDLEAKHLGKRFVQYPGGTFPFDDDQFEWVFSNAVIEHVGNRDEQINFLNEMLRVGKNVFFTTPNKYFPVESHTNTIFRHWLPGDYFYNWCKKYKPYWNRKNLHLLSYSALEQLINLSQVKNYKIYKNRFFGITMTFTVICSG